ncbi:uncharacterized protein LOC127780191 [Oryza glaberrima]|uniref:uncharacterized protein LOC127780191 n=1 Tax=Oryza glaberrima TaxID=4538 RepID=UPI00224C06F0|nr:uncharacterized protein LOC127780191 [Oryza glaberrima]
MQVPTYALYLRDNISNQRPQPTTEIVKLTEECSAAILNQLPKKKKDPGCPTIDCTIGTQHFDHALCDLGASLTDSMVRYLTGIAEDIPVRIRGCFIPMDFVVLDMDTDKDTTLILVWSFLSTTDACINVGAEEI